VVLPHHVPPAPSPHHQTATEGQGIPADDVKLNRHDCRRQIAESSKQDSLRRITASHISNLRNMHYMGEAPVTVADYEDIVQMRSQQARRRLTPAAFAQPPSVSRLNNHDVFPAAAPPTTTATHQKSAPGSSRSDLHGIAVADRPTDAGLSCQPS